jgi:hypothetical protein
MSFVRKPGVTPDELPTELDRILDLLLEQNPLGTAFHTARCCDHMRAERARGGGYTITCPVHTSVHDFKRLKPD